MKSNLRSTCLMAGLVVALAAAELAAATVDVQVGPGFSFSPASVTIQVGDSVRWTNVGGFHNVRADDDSFRCANGCDQNGGNGNPDTNAWVVSRTFNSAGTVGFYCEVHGAPGGFGMAGTIVVQGAAAQPGALQFSGSSFQVNEGAGTVAISVARSGGADGAVSVSFATANGSATAGSDYAESAGTLSWTDGDSAPKSFSLAITNDTQVEGNETILLSLGAPTGGAALGSLSTATLTINDNDSAPAGTLQFGAASTAADESAGEATITVTRGGGSSGAVSVQYQATDGSAQAGNDYQPTSGTLSWTNGDTAAKTFDVPVLDDSLLEGTETVNLALSAPTGGAVLGSPSTAVLSLTDDDEATGPCVDDDTTLCFLSGRFRLVVDWRRNDGQVGQGHRIPVTDRSGLFWFFNEQNVEMLVKMVDACSLSNSFWVFFAATTNVEFTLTVTDTVAGRSKVYTNALNHPAEPVQDTAAFVTCTGGTAE